jgi:hypothetical protein
VIECLVDFNDSQRAGTSLEAAVAMKNFSFQAGSNRESVLQVFKTLSSMTSVGIDGVTKAVVADFAT